VGFKRLHLVLLLATVLGCGATRANPPPAASSAGDQRTVMMPPVASAVHPPSTAPGARTVSPAPSATAEAEEPEAEPARVELSLSWAPDERALVVGCRDADASQPMHASMLDLGTGATPIPFGGASPADIGPVWNARGTMVALSTNLGIYLWDRQGKRARITLPFRKVQGMEWVAPTVVLSPSGALLASFTQLTVHEAYSVSTEVSIWSTLTGGRIAQIVNQPVRDEVMAITNLSWHPHDDVVLTGAGVSEWYNGSYYTGQYVRIWRAGSGQSLGRLPGHSTNFSPDGRFLAVTRGHPRREQAGSTTDIYEMRTNKRLIELKGSAEAWAPDGSWIVTSIEPYRDVNIPPDEDTVYKLWAVPGGGLTRTLDFGRGLPVLLPAKGWAAVAQMKLDEFGSNPRANGKIEIWDILTGKQLRTLGVQPNRYPGRWLAAGRVLELTNEAGALRQLLRVDTGRTVDIIGAVESQGCKVSWRSGDQDLSLAELRQWLAP
jgi:WD40 repeat protein